MMEISDMVAGIPARLKQAREDADMTQAEVAQRLAISRAQIAHYESGHTPISVEHLLKLAAILDESPIRLIGLDTRSLADLAPSVVEIVTIIQGLNDINKRTLRKLAQYLADDQHK